MSNISNLAETAMERYAINRMTEATELLYSRNGMTATQKYEAIQSIFTQLTDHAKTGSRRGLRSFGEVMEDWVSDLEKRFDPSGEQRGMSTGIPSLDRMLSPKGLVKGSLFVIGARPKMGKTTLYSQMAINCAVHEKKPALMFSLEMPGDQILEKLVGQKSGVNPNIFYLPATNDADDGYQGDYDGDFNRAIETANRLSEIDLLYIDDTPGLSLAQIVSESRRIKREKGCVGMILVDYPEFTLSEAREERSKLRRMVARGIDPNEVKKDARNEQRKMYAQSFQAVADEWLKIKIKEGARSNTLESHNVTLKHLSTIFRHTTVHKINAADTIQAFKPFRERPSTLTKMVITINAIMDYAVNIGVIEHNPLSKIGKAFPAEKNEPRATLQKERLIQVACKLAGAVHYADVQINVVR